jgi:hypothetical protein
MKKLCLFTCALLLTFSVLAQNEKGFVYLKNGTILKGKYQYTDAGLKVYDVTDKRHIDDHLIARFSTINTYDVIPVSGYLFMIGDDGFYQYDYSDLNDIRQVSFIPVKNGN